MNTFAHLVLLAFAPAAVFLFRARPLHQAVSITTIAGFLFLPVLRIPLQGLPDYSKPAAISIALLMGVLLGNKRLPRISKLHWWDAAYCAWILSTPASYLLNGYPLYNSASSLFTRLLEWGVPYWIGRSCFQSREAARSLLQLIVIGGLLYVPLALWEIRMSPQLHTNIYGAFQHSFAQMIRGDSYRPIVFTEHALVIALWFAITLTAATGLRRMRSETPKWIRNAWWIEPTLAINLLLCRSAGALVLGIIAYAALSLRLGRLALGMTILASILYVGSRIFFDEATSAFVSDWLQYLPENRAESFQYRIDMETLLMQRAWQQPSIGWCAEGFKNVSVIGANGFVEEAVTVTDSLWIIVFGTSGFLGLISLYATLLASCSRWCFHKVSGRVSEAQVLSTIAAVMVINTVPNAHFSPIAILTIGAALGVRTMPKPKRALNSKRRREAPDNIEPRKRNLNADSTLEFGIDASS